MLNQGEAPTEGASNRVCYEWHYIARNHQRRGLSDSLINTRKIPAIII